LQPPADLTAPAQLQACDGVLLAALHWHWWSAPAAHTPTPTLGPCSPKTHKHRYTTTPTTNPSALPAAAAAAACPAWVQGGDTLQVDRTDGEILFR
jgi:hypothetical protein